MSIGYYGIELDGAMAGWVSSVEGGHATSDVVTEKLGPDRIQKEHIAGVKYEDITITCGTGMSKGLCLWICDALNNASTRQNGAIICVDKDYRELSHLSFYNALIVEIGMPALDASSKDAVNMSLKLRPEITRKTTSAARTSKPAVPPKARDQWLAGSFRLRIDGLDAACARVNKIDALTIKQNVTEHDAGGQRDYEKEPASMEIPNLVITFPESHADDFYAWHEDFVIKGNNTEDKEKTGKLEYLAADSGEVLLAVTFEGLGIVTLTPDKMESGSEQIRRVKAEMYCQSIKFEYKPAWA